MIGLLYQILILLTKYIISPIFLVLVIKEIMAYLNLRKYSSQGLPTKYYPILGYAYNIFKGTSEDDIGKYVKEDSKFTKNSIIVYNKMRGSASNLFLLGSDVIREFSQIESSVGVKFSNTKTRLLGFSLGSGNEAMRQRAVFAKVFNYQILEDLCPILYKIVNKRLGKVLELIKSSPKKSINLDIKAEIYDDIIKDLSLRILLGSSEDIFDKEKNSFYLLMKNLLLSAINISFLSPANDLLYGFPERLSLHPEVWKIRKLKKK